MGDPASTEWRVHEPQPLARATFLQLLRNEIPLICIRAFASPGECARLVECASRVGFEQYEDVFPPIDRIGVTAFEHADAGMKGYFDAARGARAKQLELFERSFDPLQRFIDTLARETGMSVGVARDPQHGSYHAGLVRRIEEGTLLHIDFAPVEQPSWTVGKVQAQLSWSLYLELDDLGGGRTRLYNRPYQAADAAYKLERSYGYRHAVLGSVQPLTFRPTLGDVYLFNTRNYHEVAPSLGHRTAFTSQIGWLGDNEIVLWS